MSALWFVMTQPYREERPSFGFGGMPKSGGREGQHQQMCSNVPSSLQPFQMQEVVNSPGPRLPRAAGEKSTPTQTERASAHPSTGRSPIDSLEVTGMEAIQPRSTMRRRHMTAQAPSTPSVTNHVLPITILTMITIIIQVQRVTSISMSPFPLSIKRPTTEHAKLVPDWILTGSMDRQEPTPAPCPDPPLPSFAPILALPCTNTPPFLHQNGKSSLKPNRSSTNYNQIRTSSLSTSIGIPLCISMRWCWRSCLPSDSWTDPTWPTVSILYIFCRAPQTTGTPRTTTFHPSKSKHPQWKDMKRIAPLYIYILLPKLHKLVECILMEFGAGKGESKSWTKHVKIL